MGRRNINNARKEGIIKGKAESQKQIATEMIKEKLPIDMIIRVTKLTKEEIEELMKKID